MNDTATSLVLTRRWIVVTASLALLVVFGVILLWARKPRSEWTRLVPESPQLAKWFDEQTLPPYAGRPASSERREALSHALAGAPLTCRALVEVGKAYHMKTEDDLATAVIYAAAVARAATELPEAGQRTPAAKPIVAALADTKPVFWRAVSQDQPQYYRVMSELNTYLIDYIAPGDPDLDDARQKAHVGLVESLMYSDRIGEALKVAEATDTSELSAEVKTSATFVHGLALARAKRVADAIPFLQEAAQDPKFRDAKNVKVYLFTTLMDADRPEEARAVLDAFVKRYKNDREQARQMALMLSSTTVAGQAIKDAE